MATRLKGNKGYLALIVGESLLSAVQVATLMLVNLPLGILVTAIDLGANVVSGFLVAPKNPPPPPPAGEALSAKKSLRQSAKDVAKKAWAYNAACFKDPRYTVGASAAAAGINFLFQGLFGIQSLLATHAITILPGLAITGISLPVGLGIAAAMTTLGALSIVAGNMDKWREMRNYYHAVFRKDLPPPASGKMHKDRPVTKALKKTLLLAMTVESSLFSVVSSAGVIMSRTAAVAAAPKTILSAIAPVAVAAAWGGKSAWQLLCAGKMTVKNMLHIKSKKAAPEAAKTNAVPVPLQQQTAAPAALRDKRLAEAFVKSMEPAQKAGRDLSSQAAKTIKLKEPVV